MTQYTMHARTILALADGPSTAPTLAEKLGVNRDTARDLLHELQMEGLAQPDRLRSSPGNPILWRLK